MINTPYYLLRSKSTGQYLVARPPTEGTHPEQSAAPFLLMFIADFDALSYINAHAGEYASQFSVEYCDRTKIKSICDRWSYKGVGVVNDPLIPRIEFMSL
ncbi:hypothetical protein S7335_4185 [Synechococcus sp. PCC 7335]|uniref:hypothetical protein n=1 Tax=Synechococcus sp. (strain ATCC 29403 / PCC 7335) TaxID=91464 RepID=UPI00017EBBB1|nr:hypothetical protein [Synechococcus sp. PCC 7335]EDX86481.1 hypothetical protein S7335_4185 [Synechococcus sp. PCC 7335]